jgi:hypothetical protein
MYLLKHACRLVLSFAGEGETSLFVAETAVTELINMI